MEKHCLKQVNNMKQKATIRHHALSTAVYGGDMVMMTQSAAQY